MNIVKVVLWIFIFRLASGTVLLAEGMVVYPPDDVLDAVVSIKCDDGHVCGSGFVVDQRTVITAWHVVSNEQQIAIVLRGVEYLGYITYMSIKDDIAVLAVRSALENIQPLVPDSVLGSDMVYTAGFPGGGALTITYGRMEDVDSNGAMYTRVPADFGNSGGPYLVRREIDGQDEWFYVGVLTDIGAIATGGELMYLSDYSVGRQSRVIEKILDLSRNRELVAR